MSINQTEPLKEQLEQLFALLEENPLYVLASMPMLWRWRRVEAVAGVSRSQAHALIAQGKFPFQIKLSEKASGWLNTEIYQWLIIRVVLSRGGLPRKLYVFAELLFDEPAAIVVEKIKSRPQELKCDWYLTNCDEVEESVS